MKKYIIWILMGMMVLCSCGRKEETEKLSAFEGRWQCAETPLEHPEYYTGYLMWVINEDGSFSMYDAEAGNPGISGEIRIISDGDLQLNCDTEEDFDPPVTWESMKETEILPYVFVSDVELRVTLMSEEGDSTLTFMKSEQDIS